MSPEYRGLLSVWEAVILMQCPMRGRAIYPRVREGRDQFSIALGFQHRDQNMAPHSSQVSDVTMVLDGSTDTKMATGGSPDPGFPCGLGDNIGCQQTPPLW